MARVNIFERSIVWPFKKKIVDFLFRRNLREFFFSEHTGLSPEAL